MTNINQRCSRQVLFIQGGGEGAYDVDAKLVVNLCGALGAGYEVRYPPMPDEGESPYDLWIEVIADELGRMRDGAILVGHSIGASVLIKWLTQATLRRSLAGVFLIGAPFWHDHDVWHWMEAELPQDACARLSRDLPLCFFHGTHDEVVPITHVDLYQRAFPRARVIRLDGRNHQLNDDLTEVARDIRSLECRSPAIQETHGSYAS